MPVVRTASTNVPSERLSRRTTAFHRAESLSNERMGLSVWRTASLMEHKVPRCSLEHYPNLAVAFVRSETSSLAGVQGMKLLQGFPVSGFVEDKGAVGNGTKRGRRPGRPPSFSGRVHPAPQYPAMGIEHAGQRPSPVSRYCRIL